MEQIFFPKRVLKVVLGYGKKIYDNKIFIYVNGDRENEIFMLNEFK